MQSVPWRAHARNSVGADRPVGTPCKHGSEHHAGPLPRPLVSPKHHHRQNWHQVTRGGGVIEHCVALAGRGHPAWVHHSSSCNATASLRAKCLSRSLLPYYTKRCFHLKWAGPETAYVPEPTGWSATIKCRQWCYQTQHKATSLWISFIWPAAIGNTFPHVSHQSLVHPSRPGAWLTCLPHAACIGGVIASQALQL